MNTAQPSVATPVRLAVVMPCYNEQEALPETARVVRRLFGALSTEGLISSDSYVLLVNDGSRDKTWDVIESLHRESTLFRGLKLSRNFGHQNALLAGLMHATDADAVVSIDADLQDDPEAIRGMLEKFSAGYEVVYGVRSDRSSDSWGKRFTAQTFYKIISGLGVDSIYNHADYRLMSQRALQTLGTFHEVNLYLRGMVPLVGFKHAKVEYVRAARMAGESKYPFRKMLSFAWNGITSMSIKPLRFVTWMGFAVFGISILLAMYALLVRLFTDTVTGWASTVIPVYFLGGVQLLCTGILGEYVGKIYKEVKQRPRFIIEEFLAEETVPHPVKIHTADAHP